MTRFQRIAFKVAVFTSLFLLASIGYGLVTGNLMQADAYLLGTASAAAVYFLLSLLSDRPNVGEPNA